MSFDHKLSRTQEQFITRSKCNEWLSYYSTTFNTYIVSTYPFKKRTQLITFADVRKSLENQRQVKQTNKSKKP